MTTQDPSPSTRVTLMYRDAANYKQVDKTTFAGEPTEALIERLRAALDQGMWLIPEQVGLSNPRDEFGGLYEDDHCWCELDVGDIVTTSTVPDDPRTFEHFVVAVENAAADGWRDDLNPAECRALTAPLPTTDAQEG